MSKKLLVALSGGGVRSASCAYGFLQRLKGCGYEFDKFSSVSGGGYAVAKFLFGDDSSLRQVEQRVGGALIADVLLSIVNVCLIFLFSVKFNSLFAHYLGWESHSIVMILIVCMLLGFLKLAKLINTQIFSDWITVCLVIFIPYGLYLLGVLFDSKGKMEISSQVVLAFVFIPMSILFVHTKLLPHRYDLQYIFRLILNLSAGGFLAYHIVLNINIGLSYIFISAISFFIILLLIASENFLSFIHKNYVRFIQVFVASLTII